jgi:hypothetical protein
VRSALFSTVDAALQQGVDPSAFERVAFYVLRDQHPSLALTAPSQDDGKDLFVRRLGSLREDVRVMVSLQARWSPKLAAELATISDLDPGDRPSVAVFVTNRDPGEAALSKHRVRAEGMGVALEILGKTQLAVSLNQPHLRWVAEFELGLEPLRPRALLSAAEFARVTARLVPGFEAALVGADDIARQLREQLWSEQPDGPRIIVVEGAGGLGKTRLAVETASRDFTTLVAPTAVSLPPTEVIGLPAGDRAVLVIDDAHRCPDLSGVRALLLDERFDHTKIVMTTRPGLSDRVLASTRLAEFGSTALRLDPMPREAMAQLVRDCGIDDDRFATTVIDVARGVPLIAHAMCEAALKKGSFGGRDMVDVLNSRVADQLDELDDATRAVAVALALASSSTGVGLERYAPAVTRMPSAVEIPNALELLADTGIAQVNISESSPGERLFTYTIKPDLLAASLVAKSLNSTRGVRLKVNEFMRLVGLLEPASTHSSVLRAEDSALARLDSPLATHQVTLLVQGAAIGENGDVIERLASTIIRLIPEGATARDWKIIASLADPVAYYAPKLFGELEASLRRHWPPCPSQEPRLWFESSEQVDRYEFKQMASAVMGVVERHGVSDSASATQLALTAAALLRPYVDGEAVSAERAVKAIIAPRRAETWEQCLDRRSVVIDAITAWVGVRLAGASASGALISSHESIAVALDALTATMDPIVEMTYLGSPDAADVLVLSGGHLPDGAATTRVLHEAALAAASLLDSVAVVLDPYRPDELLRAFIAIPFGQWALGVRGAPFGGGPVPDGLRKTLAINGRTVEDALARRWDALPLWARYEALRSVQQIRPPRTLKQRARSGSPVARAACEDDELRRLIALAPMERDERSTTRENAAATRDAARARQLAHSLEIAEAIEMLRVIAVLKRTHRMHDPVVDFIDELARLASDEDDAAFLLETAFAPPPMVGSDRLVAQLCTQHAGVFAGYLRDRVNDADDLPLLLDVIPRVDDGRLRHELTLTTLDVIASTEATRVEGRVEVDDAGTHVRGSVLGAAALMNNVIGVGNVILEGVVPPVLARQAKRPVRAFKRFGGLALEAVVDRLGHRSSPVEPGERSGGLIAATKRGDSSATGTVQPQQLARQWVLMTWRLPDDDDPADGLSSPAIGWRIDALVRMGLEGPVAVVGDVLQRATYRARRAGTQSPQTVAGEAEEVLSPAQIDGLMRVLARALASSNGRGFDDLVDDWDHGAAVAALAVLAPEELSSVIAPWLLTSDGSSRRWPIQWESELSDMALEHRVVFGVALKARLDERLAAIVFGAERDVELAQFDLDRDLALLLRDSGEWKATLIGWIDSGSEIERAAAVLAKSWRSQDWPGLMDRLLSAEPAPKVLEALSLGLAPSAFGPDLAEDIESRLQALSAIDRQRSGRAAGFVDASTAVLRGVLEEYAEDAASRRAGY